MHTALIDCCAVDGVRHTRFDGEATSHMAVEVVMTTKQLLNTIEVLAHQVPVAYRKQLLETITEAV